MSEIPSERSEMSPSAEASELLRRLAEPAPAGVHIEALIRRVSRRVGIGFSRAKSIWYGEARRIDSEEMDRLRKAVVDQYEGREFELRIRYETLTRELEFLRERLAAERQERAG